MHQKRHSEALKLRFKHTDEEEDDEEEDEELAPLVLVVTVVGAGRGPLVAAALTAA